MKGGPAQCKFYVNDSEPKCLPGKETWKKRLTIEEIKELLG